MVINPIWTDGFVEFTWIYIYIGLSQKKTLFQIIFKKGQKQQNGEFLEFDIKWWWKINAAWLLLAPTGPSVIGGMDYIAKIYRVNICSVMLYDDKDLYDSNFFQHSRCQFIKEFTN